MLLRKDLRYHGVCRVGVVLCSEVDAVEHERQGVYRLRAGDELNIPKQSYIQCLSPGK